MEKKYELTVKEILTRQSFQSAEVVAGKKGLDRRIRWVHILEVTNFESLIHGGEVILTTGIGTRLDTSAQKAFLEKLIDLHAACLCIELGSHFENIPRQLIELADNSNFPIIVFKNIVRFVDITQDLHGLLINHQHDMLKRLEITSRNFLQLALTSEGVQNLLRTLNSMINANAIFIPNSGKPVFYPLLKKNEREALIDHLTKKDESPFGENTYVLIQPVEVLGQVWGHLYLYFKKSTPQELDQLILDRAALAIAQVLLRKRTKEERKLHSEELWVSELLRNQTVDETEIESRLGFNIDEIHFRVVLIDIGRLTRELNEEDWEDLRLQRSLLIRTIFQRYGYTPLVTTNKHQVAVIAISHLNRESEKDHFLKVIAHITSTLGDSDLGNGVCNIGIGRNYHDISKVNQSYKEAKNVISLSQLKKGENRYFYEELGVYRMIIPLTEEPDLLHFVYDYLGPIIEHDQKKGSQLLETLKVFLDNHGSKQEAAEQLFVVRQTLYHRIEKIKQLIGEDFMLAEKRIALEIAIRAYQLTKTKAFPQKNKQSKYFS